MTLKAVPRARLDEGDKSLLSDLLRSRYQQFIAGTLGALLAVSAGGCAIAADDVNYTEETQPQVQTRALAHVAPATGDWVNGLNRAIVTARDTAEPGRPRRNAIGAALDGYLLNNPSDLGDRLRELFGREVGPNTGVLELSSRIRELAGDGWLLDLKSFDGDGDLLLPVVDEPLDLNATVAALDRVFSPDKPDYVMPIFVDAELTEPAYSLGDLAVVNLSNSRDRVLQFRTTGSLARRYFESNVYTRITESSVANELAHTTLVTRYNFDIVGDADVPASVRALKPETNFDALQVHQFISDAASLSATRHAIWMMVHHYLAVATEPANGSVNRSNYELSTLVFEKSIHDAARARGVAVNLDDWSRAVRRDLAVVRGHRRQKEFERIVGIYAADLALTLGESGLDEIRQRHIDVARDMLALIRVRAGLTPVQPHG